MPCAYALYEPFKAFLCLPINVDKICIQLAACEKNVRKIRSTQDDGREGESNSIVNQKEYLMKYAKEHGFSNPKFYVDDGYTGTNLKTSIPLLLTGNYGTKCR